MLLTDFDFSSCSVSHSRWSSFEVSMRWWHLFFGSSLGWLGRFDGFGLLGRHDLV
jgi:hypothetical protein